MCSMQSTQSRRIRPPSRPAAAESWAANTGWETTLWIPQTPSDPMIPQVRLVLLIVTAITISIMFQEWSQLTRARPCCLTWPAPARPLGLGARGRGTSEAGAVRTRLWSEARAARADTGASTRTWTTRLSTTGRVSSLWQMIKWNVRELVLIVYSHRSQSKLHSYSCSGYWQWQWISVCLEMT